MDAMGHIQWIDKIAHKPDAKRLVSKTAAYFREREEAALDGE